MKKILLIGLLLSQLAWARSANQAYIMPTSGNIPIWGQLDVSQSAAVKNQLPVANGGTGVASLTAHDVVVGAGTSAVTLVSPSNSGYVLTSNGTSADPTFQAASTGFSNPMTTLGDLMYENSTPVAARLAGNTTSTLNVLTQTGTGSASAAPVWTSSTGTGNVVLATSPTLTTPVIGAATGTSVSVSGALTSATQALTGSSSGTITIQPQAAAGTYNFNLPTTAGTSGFVLASAGGSTSPMTWASVLTNPMTTGGDIIYGGSSGTPTRLANGSAQQFLTSAGSTSAPTWTGPVVFIGTGAPSSYTANTPIIIPTVLKDTSSSYSNSTGEFTAPNTAYYQCNIIMNTNQAAQSTVYVYVNGSVYTAIGAGYSGNGNIGGSGIVFATAGQTIDFRFPSPWTAVGGAQSGASIAQIR